MLSEVQTTNGNYFALFQRTEVFTLHQLLHKRRRFQSMSAAFALDNRWSALKRCRLHVQATVVTAAINSSHRQTFSHIGIIGFRSIRSSVVSLSSVHPHSMQANIVFFVTVAQQHRAIMCRRCKISMGEIDYFSEVFRMKKLTPLKTKFNPRD